MFQQDSESSLLTGTLGLLFSSATLVCVATCLLVYIFYNHWDTKGKFYINAVKENITENNFFIFYGKHFTH